MEDLRDPSASGSAEATKNVEQKPPLSPYTNSLLHSIYSTDDEEYDKTLVPSDANTSMPASSSMINADPVDAGATSTNFRKRSHTASQELKDENLNASITARLAKNDLGKLQKEIEQENNNLNGDTSSEPSNKRQRLGVIKKSTTKTSSSNWMKFLNYIPNLCEPKVFSQWIKELKAPESNEDMLKKLASNPEFLSSDKSLDTMLSVQGFKENISQRLCDGHSDEILQRIPAKKICNYVCASKR